MKAMVVHVLLGAVTLLSLTSVLAQNNCNLRSRLVTYRYWINYPYTYGTYQVIEYYCDFSEHPSSLPEGLLRLAEQDTQANHVEGRPEVYHSGEWGTICDNGWDSNDAHSVCQQLGFSGPDQTCCSSQGSGTGRVWIENLQCEITDDWISQDCGITTWGSTCDHSQDAGLRCERAPRVRLVNGADVNILRGRVEYRHGNAWGKVCDDYWDDQDSRVVCHQLGFGTHTSFTTHTTTPRTIDVFGMDTGAYFLMDNLFCFGSEIALHHCAHNGWENHNCYYYEAVGLYCSMPVPRISAGGSSSSSLHVSLEMLEGLQYSVTITGYHVEYRESGESSWLERTVHATSYRHSFNLTGLNPYTTYDLRAAVLVQEFMATENITYSDVLQATTFEGAPGPVSSLNVVGASATSITVTWGEPAQTNGRISDYVITYSSITPGIQHSGRTIASATATSYTLTGLQEFTTYAVTVSARTLAAEGVQSQASTTTFEAVPSASPNEVGATPLSSNIISLSWVPPDLIGQNGQITSYDVMYSGGDISAITHDVGSSTTYILAGLQPYTTYSISVAAKNSQGRGPFSTPIEQATLEGAPSGPPLNVTLTALSAESLQVMWQHPSVENGQISAYTVHWGRDLSNPTSVAVQGDALSYRITGTLPYTIYHARVAASTNGGQGPFSSWRTATTLSAAPTAAPLNVVVTDIGSTSVRVSWMPPPEDSRNGPITAYMVVFGAVPSNTPLGSAEVSGALQYTVSNLQPYAQFYVQVAAKTSAGVGPYSASITFNTLSDAPGAAPGDVALQSDPSQAAITVSWSPLPSQFYNSDELTGYTIHYEANDVRIQSSGDVTTGPTATSRTLTGLHARVAYTISVAAVNSQGTGPYSSEQTAITSGQAPDSAPVGVSATATSPSSIQVQWSSPPSPDHQLPILTYTVSYQLVGPLASFFNKTVTAVEEDTHRTDITGLRAYRQYVITVYSNNELGQSPPSDQVTVWTLSDIPLFAPNFTSPLVLTTEITLMWQPLTEEQARGNVVQYLIKWSGGTTLMLGPDATTHTFSVDPATSYTFTIAASTAGGIGPYSDPLSVTSLDGIPSAPREFRATVVSPTTIQLTWQAPSSPNGAYVYIISITVLGASDESLSEIQVESSLVQYTVDGLEENTRYEFYLQAVTSAGKGERVIATAQTSEAAPSSPPLNVTAGAVTATTISVSWVTPPIIHHNSPLTGYTIQYRTAAVGSVSMQMDVSSPQQLQTAVVELTPYTVYYIKVAAVNAIGIGPYSREVSAETLKSEPSQPQGMNVNAVSSTELRVTWTLPANPNGVLLGYTLRYEASYPPDIDSSGEELPGPDATYLVIVDLHPGTSYNIYLLARNDIGMSETVQGTAYTMPEVPTAAPSVSVSALSSMVLRVAWNPPTTTTWMGTIQELHLEYGLVVYNETEDAMEQTLTIAISPLAQPDDIAGSMNITGLMPFAEYYVRMSLMNNAGEGPYSEATSAMTLQDLPSAVRDLSVHVNYTNVTATWSTPRNVNGELLYYKVYLNGVFLKTVPSSSYKLTIDNLKPRTQHTASVSAVTGAGEGEMSRYTFQTGDAPPATGVASGQTSIANNSPLLYSLIGAGVVIVLIVIAIVFLLGVLAWRRVKTAKQDKSPGYAIDSLTLYDDNPFADTEGYQVQENPGASSLNPVFMGAGDIKGQLASLEKALEDYQSGDYYESGENADKKPLV